MHIEPGVIDGAKMMLGYATAAGAITYATKLSFDTIKQSGFSALLVRSLLATVAVFFYFQVLPHYPVGVSEVHLIMGSTLFLLFGAGPAAIGLATGLLLQVVFIAPADVPQYGINVTTLLVPLFAMSALASKIIPAGTAYKDLGYSQALKLSTAYQGGIVAWVAFWAFYGQGFGAETLVSVGTFGLAYMSVIIIEPIADLGALAIAKAWSDLKGSSVVSERIYSPAA